MSFGMLEFAKSAALHNFYEIVCLVIVSRCFEGFQCLKYQIYSCVGDIVYWAWF